jgi:hypothetical protein
LTDAAAATMPKSFGVSMRPSTVSTTSRTPLVATAPAKLHEIPRRVW